MEEFKPYQPEPEPVTEETVEPQPLMADFSKLRTAMEHVSEGLGMQETAEMAALRSGSEEERRANFAAYNTLAREVVEAAQGDQYEFGQVWLATIMLLQCIACGKLENLEDDIQDLRDMIQFGIELPEEMARDIEFICVVGEMQLGR